MAYVKSNSKIDQLAAALGPNAGSVDDQDPSAAANVPNTIEIRKAYIEKCSQIKYVDSGTWAQEKPRNIPESIADAIDGKNAKGEIVEADLNKAIFTYRNRNMDNWSQVDLEKMEKAEEDDDLLQKGSFVRWG